MTDIGSQPAAVESFSATPAVSVVIPAYNAALFINEALASVFAQTFTDYEVIVVNDGSPDTADLERTIAPWLGRIIYLKQDNRGPGGARNAAIEVARGEYVAMLDSDDAWLPEYLAEQLRVINANPNVDMVYADARFFGDTGFAGRTFMQCSPSRGPVTFESLLRYESSIITSCSVVRREALISAGLFDEKFIRCEDFDLWLRLTHQGRRIVYQTQVLGRHRAHDASLAADAIKMVESQMEVLKKAERVLSLTPAQRSLVQRQLANCAAQIDLELGKRYFVDHDYPQAIRALGRANEFYKSAKLRLVLWALSFAPDVFHTLYLWRKNLGPTLARPASQR